MAKKSTSAVTKSSLAPEPLMLCPEGVCVWIKTAEGWEHFDTCGSPDCHCPSAPPVLRPIVKIGQAIITLCEDNKKFKLSTILSQGIVTFWDGFKIDPVYSDDYCAAISESPGRWRYCHRGANRERDEHKGHLDTVKLPRGVIRLDRLNKDGAESLELCAIGLIEPRFGGDPLVQAELAQYIK